MKDAYYFSHDSNARHDPKMTAMRGVYGSEGYGWFWMLIEMMRETDGYQLDMQSRYIWNAYAYQLQCNAEEIKKFVADCINEFNLFASDGNSFWSNSLLNRMEKKEEKSAKRRKAAQTRWSKEKESNEDNDQIDSEDAKYMQMQSENMQMQSNADANSNYAMQTDAKESKEKESKRKESKVNEIDDIRPSPESFMQENGFGLTIPKSISDQITEWMNGPEFDEPQEIILEALQQAVNQNKKNWAYVNKILNTWANEGLRNLALVKERLRKFEESKQSPKLNIKPRSEPLPTWVEKQESSQAEELSEEQKRQAEELLRLLGE